MTIETLTFDILARNRASATFKKISKDSDGLHKSSKDLTSGLKTLSAGMAGIAAVTVFSGFIREAREAAKVGRITDAAIKSTGGAANVTAKQVSSLADSISRKVGVDDEAVQSAENLLLTFTNVRNEAGKGNDVFNQASQAIVDMTAAMNGGQVTEEGLRSSTVRLGKALNDPIKGMTALRKVGVAFTDQQTEQIKTLVESGDTLQAQKIILGELTKEFGGVAEAAADPAQKLHVAWENLQEQVGTAVLPAMNAASDALAGLAGKFSDLDPLTQNVVIGISAIGIAALVAGPRIITMGTALKEAGVSAGALSSGLGVASIAMIAFTATSDASLKKLSDDTEGVFGKFAEMGKAVLHTGGNVGAALLGMTGESKNLETQTDDTKTAADEYNKILGGTGGLTASVQGLADATEDAYLQQQLLNGSLIAADIAGIQFTDSVVAWTKQIKESRKAGEKNATSLSLQAQAGRDNRTALLNMIQSANDHADAVYKQTGNVDKANQVLKTDRTRLLDAADAAGFNRKQVERLTDKYLKIPKKSKTDISQPGMADAQRKADSLKNKMQFLERHDWSVGVRMAMKNRLRIAAQQGVALTITGKPIALATGGMVQGPSGLDKVPAKLTAGEYVVKKSSVDKVGVGFLNQINDIGGDPSGMIAKTTPGPIKFASGGLVSKARDLVYNQRNDPYVWGGVGPNGFDCSGLVGLGYAYLMGLPLFNRYFNTRSSFGPIGWKRGTGAFTMGVRPGVHMAGNIGGLPFEAASHRLGIRVGSAATPVTSFPQQWYLASVGGKLGSLGTITLDSADLKKIMKAVSLNWGARYTKGVPYDDGGWLRPGTTVAVNNTGQPERVLGASGKVELGDKTIDKLARVIIGAIGAAGNVSARRADLYARAG